MLDAEPDRDVRVKLARRIAKYNNEERRIIEELNR